MGIEGTINTAIYAIIGLVVLFKLYASLVPEAQTAGDELNASGVPLGSFFVADGIVFLLVMVGLFITVLRSVMKKGNK
jgi:hypothetical protein